MGDDTFVSVSLKSDSGGDFRGEIFFFSSHCATGTIRGVKNPLDSLKHEDSSEFEGVGASSAFVFVSAVFLVAISFGELFGVEGLTFFMTEDLTKKLSSELCSIT